MATPITVNYTPDGDDWQVSVVRGEETSTGRAPGLIAARDTADQLVEKLTKGAEATVVHLLEGDAVAFSTAYLHARHGGHAGAPAEEDHASDDGTEAAAEVAESEEKPSDDAETAWPEDQDTQEENGPVSVSAAVQATDTASPVRSEALS